MLPRHSDLVCENMFGRHVVVVKCVAEAVSNRHLGIMQYRISHQPSLKSEIHILHPPGAHKTVKSPQFLVELSMYCKATANERRGRIESFRGSAKRPHLVQSYPSTPQCLEFHRKSMSRPVAAILPARGVKG